MRISVKKHGTSEEQLVKGINFQSCAVICSSDRQSGKACNFYLLLPSQEEGKAICKYGFLKDIMKYSFMKKDKSISMVRVLTGQTFGK